MPRGTFVSELSNGLNADCAITLEDGLDCWCEALDESQAETAACRRLLAYPTGAFVDVNMGDYHACVLDVQGSATCWGGFWSGTDSVVPDDQLFTQIVAGSEVTCGINTDAELGCWSLIREVDFQNYYSETWPAATLMENPPPPGNRYVYVSEIGSSDVAIRVNGLPVNFGEMPEGSYLEALGLR